MSNRMQSFGAKYGTDKITHHKYHEIFDYYISEFYEQPAGMLEIGLKHGASLKMWLDVFPKMHIYVLDISPAFDTYGDRSTIIRCNQGLPDKLDDAISQIKHNLKFINDDGSHVPQHQLLTFNKLFPILDNGGVYIIEDISTSYWEKDNPHLISMKSHGFTGYGLYHPDSIMEVFKKALDGLGHNHFHKYGFNGDVEHQELIHSITFAKNCIIIRKKY